jgi:hypothetical protein
LRFEETTGRRAEVALELLTEGPHITYCGLGLQLAGSALDCRVFVESHPESIDAATAAHEFALAKAPLDQLLTDPRFASTLAGCSQRWELLWDYGGGAVRLCRLDRAGKLLWEAGCPKAGV